MCLCVSTLTAEPFDTKFGTGIDLDGILHKFDGQGQRSRSLGQKMSFPGFSDLSDVI